MKQETKDKVKNGLIIALIILIGLFAFFGGKKVRKYEKDIASLSYDKTALKTQNALLENKNKVIEAQNKKQKVTIDSCQVVFKKKDRVIAVLSADLDTALTRLNGITSDSSYQFLQKVAYAFPGTLEYLFNALQVRGIHTDYLKARNSEKIIPVYKEQIENCKVQLIARDNIESGLNTLINNKDQQLANCEKINQDNDKIIKDTEKQRDKEKRRKNFWRFSASVTTGVAIILAVFVL